MVTCRHYFCLRDYTIKPFNLSLKLKEKGIVQNLVIYYVLRIKPIYY